MREARFRTVNRKSCRWFASLSLLKSLRVRQLRGLLLLSLVFTAACSNAPYRHQALDQFDIVQRAETQASERFSIKASVPGDEEAEALFGIDVYGRNVQPIWLLITNNDDSQARVAISSIDEKYFPPAEVAYFFRKKFSKEGWMDLEKRLLSLSLPRFIKPGETASGFVFTHLSPGTKAFNLDVFQGTMPPSFEQFTFFIQVPGFVPDYAAVRVEERYSEDELTPIEEADLLTALERMECCTSNQDGSQPGRPIDLYLVSHPSDLLRGLLRAGWSETPAERSSLLPAQVYYFQGRRADGIFRKPRDQSNDRSELDIWKTPLLVNGKPVWAAQLRHSIGRRFPLDEHLFGVRLDPDTDEGRNFLLQNFWYSQSLEKWGVAPTGVVQAQSSPVQDFLGNPWFSVDGLQLVLWLSEEPVAMSEVTFVALDQLEASSGEGR